MLFQLYFKSACPAGARPTAALLRSNVEGLNANSPFNEPEVSNAQPNYLARFVKRVQQDLQKDATESYPTRRYLADFESDKFSPFSRLFVLARSVFRNNRSAF